MKTEEPLPKRSRWAEKPPTRSQWAKPKPFKPEAEDVDVAVVGTPNDKAALLAAEETVRGLKPVVMLPTSEAAVLNNLACRELIDPSGPIDPPSPTIRLLRSTVHAIARGNDISAYKEELARISANQGEKTDLVLSQLSQLDTERLPALVEMNDNFTRLIQAASRRKDVTVGEAMAGWRIAKEEISQLRQKLEANRTLNVDGNLAVDKIDSSHQIANSVTAEKWQYTTPQGRELIRKALWEIKQEIINVAAAPA